MDFEKYANSKFYSFFNLLYKLMIINLIWFFLSITGLMIFTFMPTTVALFIMINSVIKQHEFPLFKSFFTIFKKEYWKSQKIFFVLLIIGGILSFNISFFYQTAGESYFNSISLWISFMIFVVFIFTCIHVIPVYIHFPHLNTFKTIKYSVLLSLAFPLQTLIILISNIVFLFLVTYFIRLFPFFTFLYMTLMAYISLSLLKPKYAKLMKDKLPLDVENYL